MYTTDNFLKHGAEESWRKDGIAKTAGRNSKLILFSHQAQGTLDTRPRNGAHHAS